MAQTKTIKIKALAPVADVANHGDLDEAKILYARTGYCRHDDPTEPFELYGCNRMQIQCKVCSKILEEWLV